jgi:hypothetical protein
MLKYAVGFQRDLEAVTIYYVSPFKNYNYDKKRTTGCESLDHVVLQFPLPEDLYRVHLREMRQNVSQGSPHVKVDSPLRDVRLPFRDE